MSQREIEVIRHRLAAARNYSGGFSVESARATWYAYTDGFETPDGLAVRSDRLGACEVEWTQRMGTADDRVLLYLHGGGYVCGSPRTHRPITAEAAKSFPGAVASLDYRLAPEHPCPAAVEDTVAAVEELYRRGIRPERLALAGESAGGGLVVAALVALRDRGSPLPTAGWLVSPWADLTNSGDTVCDNAHRDPIVFRESLEASARLYLGDRDRRDRLASPRHADLRGLPPLLIQVGACEVLLDDAVGLSRAAGLADVEVTLQVWPRMVHAWHIFAAELEEGRLATAEATDWLARRLHDASHSPAKPADSAPGS
jgi:epsilon-lactone hydrolase